MPVLKMRVPCLIYKYQGVNGYGEHQYSEKPIKTVCSLVDAREDDNKTTVRVDSSATKGNAKEQTFDVRMLISKTIDINLMDKIVAGKFRLKVVRVSPRYTVFGRLDHYELRCDHEKLVVR